MLKTDALTRNIVEHVPAFFHNEVASTTVDFGDGGNSGSARVQGWSAQEREFVWSVGGSSSLHMAAPDVDGDLALDLVVGRPVGSDVLEAQLLVVIVNGHTLGRFIVTQTCQLTCFIRCGMFEAGELLDIKFEHPCFARPDMLGISQDNRPLAVSFLKLRARPAHSAAPEDTLPWPNLPEPPLPIAALPDCEQLLSGRNHAARERRVYNFGDESPDLSVLRSGWTIDARQVRSAAQISVVELPSPQSVAPHRITIGLQPILIRYLRPTQRLNVLVNGFVVGQFSIGHDTAISVPLLAELWHEAESIRLTLVSPDAVPMDRFGLGASAEAVAFTLDWIVIEPLPAHLMTLALMRGDEITPPQALQRSDQFVDEPLCELPTAIETALGIRAADLMRNFESLGNNCAFGLAQRKSDAEILGLLRFANAPLKNMLRGLMDGFQALRDASEIEFRLADVGAPREFLAYVGRYGIRWHTNVLEDATTADAIAAEQSGRLAYLQRRFVNGLAKGQKIYTLANADPVKVGVVAPTYDGRRVYEAAPIPLSVAEALAVLLELNRHSANTLLYIVPTRPGQRSGAVDLIAPGLMRGYLDSFVITPDVDIADHADWLRLCANAWTLCQGSKPQIEEGLAA